MERKNRDVDLTSNGNMVSPPSSTSDRYNKKEATCVKVRQYNHYYCWETLNSIMNNDYNQVFNSIHINYDCYELPETWFMLYRDAASEYNISF